MEKSQRTKRIFCFLLPLLLLSVAALAQTGLKKRRPLPYEYGAGFEEWEEEEEEWR